MIRLIIIGCNGNMGKVVARNAVESGEFNIVAGVDISGQQNGSFPVYARHSEIREAADVMIDFSHPSCLSASLEYAAGHHLPAVIATTGLSAEQKEEIRRTSRYVPVFFSFNMSLGVNLVTGLVKKAAAVLFEDFDIEIVEKHHNQKLDAPSGTALMIADAIGESLEGKPQYTYDRHSQRKKRGKNEIGISSVRGGTIVGEHEVIFAGKDEIIEIRHSAMSKDIFATGALKAARYLIGRENGLYDMNHLVGAE